MSKLLPWNVYDDVIYEMEVDSPYFGFAVSGGECKLNSTTTVFRILIVDEKQNDVYRYSFNSSWCPGDQKHWLLNIITKQYLETIIQSRSNYKNRIKDLSKSFLDMIGIDIL